MNINIKQIALPTKTVEVAYSPIPGFVVTIGYISNELTRKLIKDSQESKYDQDNGLTYSETNMEKFGEEFCKHAIVGWKGLTGEALASLMLVDLEGNGIKPEDEISYSLDNAHTLYLNSAAFAKWVGIQAKNLSLFR